MGHKTDYEWVINEINTDGDIEDHRYFDELSILDKACVSAFSEVDGATYSLELWKNVGDEFDGLIDRQIATFDSVFNLIESQSEYDPPKYKLQELERFAEKLI